MMRSHFAIAVGAPPKWIDNALRQLDRATANTPDEARWLGLVHTLHTDVECSLRMAAALADQVLDKRNTERFVHLSVGEEQRFEVVVDLWRDHTIHLARLSLALERPVTERRGRPRAKSTRGLVRERAAAYGVDVARLEEGRHRTVEQRLTRLDENIAFLNAARLSSAKARTGR